MRGEWQEPVRDERLASLRGFRDSLAQGCCGCIAVLALLVVAFSFFYFLFGMTSVLANAWDIVSHWLLLSALVL